MASARGVYRAIEQFDFALSENEAGNGASARFPPKFEAMQNQVAIKKAPHRNR